MVDKLGGVISKVGAALGWQEYLLWVRPEAAGAAAATAAGDPPTALLSSTSGRVGEFLFHFLPSVSAPVYHLQVYRYSHNLMTIDELKTQIFFNITAISHYYLTAVSLLSHC